MNAKRDMPSKKPALAETSLRLIPGIRLTVTASSTFCTISQATAGTIVRIQGNKIETINSSIPPREDWETTLIPNALPVNRERYNKRELMVVRSGR